jgi:hypothetical protein
MGDMYPVVSVSGGNEILALPENPTQGSKDGDSAPTNGTESPRHAPALLMSHSARLHQSIAGQRRLPPSPPHAVRRSRLLTFSWTLMKAGLPETPTWTNWLKVSGTWAT